MPAINALFSKICGPDMSAESRAFSSTSSSTWISLTSAARVPRS
jgi:hypothetical protein